MRIVYSRGSSKLHSPYKVKLSKIMKKYRNFRLQDWIILIIFHVILIFLFLSNQTIVKNIGLLVALWCIIDLIEIKNLTKIDVNIYMVTPHPFYKLFLKLSFKELLSIKLISVLIACIYFFLHENFLIYNFLLLSLFLLNIFITILLYHIAYRHIKYATIIRYLYLIPFLILGLIIKSELLKIGTDIKVLLKSYTSILTFIIVLILTFCFTLIFTNIIIHTQPFIQREYLKKIKKTNWHW